VRVRAAQRRVADGRKAGALTSMNDEMSAKGRPSARGRGERASSGHKPGRGGAGLFVATREARRGGARRRALTVDFLVEHLRLEAVNSVEGAARHALRQQPARSQAAASRTCCPAARRRWPAQRTCRRSGTSGTRILCGAGRCACDQRAGGRACLHTNDFLPRLRSRARLNLRGLLQAVAHRWATRARWSARLGAARRTGQHQSAEGAAVTVAVRCVAACC
jgi:hypothetical protein